MLSPKKLKEKQGRYDLVVFLKDEKAYSFSEIANEMNMTKGWAHWAYYKAKNSPKKVLSTDQA